MKNKLSFIFLLCGLVACDQAENVYIGEKYLGAKYVLDPLGEEMAPDTDPLIRYDAFDCLTFVETALADGDVAKLTKIRYKNGEVNFVNRNHFASADWVQNNKEMIENVSRLYGKTATRTAVIDKQNWFKRVHNIDVDIPKQTVKIEYAPYSLLQQIKTTEPLIVMFVVDNPKFIDKIGTDLVVSHVGFVLPNGKLRHASKDHERVVDVDFKEYINKRSKNKHNLGVILWKIK